MAAHFTNRTGKRTYGRSVLSCFLGIAVAAILTAVMLMMLAKKEAPTPPERDDRYSISVSLPIFPGCGFVVTSENPVRVTPASDVSFRVSILDGYKVHEKQPDGLEYDPETGTVVVKQVTYPSDVLFSVRPIQVYRVGVSNPENMIVVGVPEDGLVPEDSVIKVTAKDLAGRRFIGFSVGGTVAEGGRMVSYSNGYEFVATEDTLLYPNYLSGDAETIFYDANGGTVGDTSETVFVVENRDTYYLCPNTLPDRDFITREGYVLYGYNTKADGSGTFYGLGWNIVVPENKYVYLYAMWAKESDASLFAYTKEKNAITITGYLGEESTVVIPSFIEGYPVRKIAQNAFRDGTLETLIVSKSVREIQSEAFLNCQGLTTFYMPDLITQIGDDSFKGCSSLQKLYVNAVTNPRYTNHRDGTYQIKLERLLTAPSPKLVMVSGSSSAYGLDSKLLEDKLGGQYHVVNYGAKSDTTSTFYLELISHFVKEGDILIFAPEPINYQFGYNAVNTLLWQVFEAAYDAFSYVDIRHFDSVFDSFAQFNQARLQRDEQTYSAHSEETVNQYGDYCDFKPNKTDSYIKGKPEHSFATDLLKEEEVANLNRCLDLVAASGATVYLSFAPINVNALTAEGRRIEVQNRFVEAIDTMLHGIRISHLKDYVMAGRYFYNSNLHPSTEGCGIRTEALANDILAQFAKGPVS